MAPRRKGCKSRLMRLAAAVDAMKPFGFEQRQVEAKVKELLKEYGGTDYYLFIEMDGYRVLLEALLCDQGCDPADKAQEDFSAGECSIQNVLQETHGPNDLSVSEFPRPLNGVVHESKYHYPPTSESPFVPKQNRRFTERKLLGDPRSTTRQAEHSASRDNSKRQGKRRWDVMPDDM